jgi:hypothetical protein
VSSSWLADCICRHLPAGTGTGSRVPAGVAGGSPDRSAEAAGKAASAAVAGIGDGRGRGVRARRGAGGELGPGRCWPGTAAASARGPGCVPPSASMPDRLPRLLDADEFEAAPSACLAQAALDPAIPAAYAVMRPPPPCYITHMPGGFRK